MKDIGIKYLGFALIKLVKLISLNLNLEKYR